MFSATQHLTSSNPKFIGVILLAESRVSTYSDVVYFHFARLHLGLNYMQHLIRW